MAPGGGHGVAHAQIAFSPRPWPRCPVCEWIAQTRASAIRGITASRHRGIAVLTCLAVDNRGFDWAHSRLRLRLHARLTSPPPGQKLPLRKLLTDCHRPVLVKLGRHTYGVRSTAPRMRMTTTEGPVTNARRPSYPAPLKLSPPATTTPAKSRHMMFFQLLAQKASELSPA
jgi:hypothetical protein